MSGSLCETLGGCSYGSEVDLSKFQEDAYKEHSVSEPPVRATHLQRCFFGSVMTQLEGSEFSPLLVGLFLPLMGIKRFDHRTKVKARSARRNLQAASQLCTKQVGTGEINQIIESLLKVKVQRITKTY